ncbi:MAG: GNAT family N-acetyltransferase [Paucibacter sp.]|nr:GNAT family N-acetyltransferase [Roseateles sp.]
MPRLSYARRVEILRTPRLLLREFTPDDALFVLELLSDPDWHRFISDPGVRDATQARDWMASRLFEPYRRLGYGFWAVELLAGNEPSGLLVGLCGLFKRDSLPEPDLGYALLPRHRGHGYAREAAAACVRHARERLAFPTLMAITATDNAVSQRLLRELGFGDLGEQWLAGYEVPSRVFRTDF